MSLKKIKTKELKRIIKDYENEESNLLGEYLKFKREGKYTKSHAVEQKMNVYKQVIQDLQILIHDPRDTPSF